MASRGDSQGFAIWGPVFRLFCGPADGLRVFSALGATPAAWAGRGVAMANGHPAVRAAAHDVTTLSNEDDGVAAYLESMLL